MFAVIELKYDKGKVLLAKKAWLLKQQKCYNKTDDVFCYWSPDLNDTVEKMNCEYALEYSGEPGLFKVFVIKLADTLEEAEKVFQGRVTTVAKRFREPGNTDEEIKKMEAKKKRVHKKDLKAKQGQAHTSNIKYLVDEIKLQTSTASANDCVANDTNPKNVVAKRAESTTIINDIEITEALASEPIPEKGNESVLSPDVSQSTVQPSSTNHFLSIPQSPVKFLSDYPCSSTDQQASTTIDPPASTGIISFDFASLNIPYDALIEDLMTDGLNFPIDQNTFEALDSEIEISSEPSLEASTASANAIITCNKDPEIVTLNYDELIQKNKNLELEVQNLGISNQNLQVQLESSNKRNLALQNYLVSVDERVPETLYIDKVIVHKKKEMIVKINKVLVASRKEGGRLYRGGIFLTKKQCAVLDKTNSDSEFINNLLVCLFGREILKSHSLTGRRSNRTKGLPKPALDKERINLLYEIVDARSVLRKTKKLTTSQKNGVISKKLANVSSYEPKNS